MKRFLFWSSMILLLVAPEAWAQELTGRIAGTVKDPEGLVVPDVAITARHTDTNTIYRTTTTAQGRFVIPKVRLGGYAVTAEAPGFRRAVVSGVTVEVGGVAEVNFRLELGDIQQEVTVTAETSQQIVNTIDAELGTVVDQRRVLELPLNGRNAAELIFLQAGAYYELNPDGMGDKFFVHGQRHRSANFTVDGIDTQDNLNRASSVMINQPLLAMASENVQEFRVVSGISSAEFGRGGVHISAVTRGGGNKFHGSVFWFHRNDIFNANDFFNNLAGVERSKLIRNQFGGRIGGPILEDKLFFFFGYQQTRESRGIPVHRVVWTADARQGIFKWFDSGGTLRQVNLLECGTNVQTILGRDCVDSRFDLTNLPTIDPFINNRVLAALPLPNTPGGDGLNTGGFRFNSRSLTYEHLPSFRLDWRINNQHTFYGTTNYIDRNIDGDFINGREPVYPGLRALGSRLTHSRGFSGTLISTFTPTMINEFRVGRLGGENAFIRNQPFNTPEFTLDFDDISDPYEPGGGDSVRDNVTLHVRDVYSWVRGSHQFKFGGEWRHRTVDNASFFESAPLGEIDFNDSDNPPGFSSGNLRAMAGGATSLSSTDRNNAEELLNNLVGAIGEIEIRYNVLSLQDNAFGPPGTPERRKYRAREMDLFVQDSWSLTRNLNLNLGLRWEWAGVPVETRGLLLLPEGGADSVFGVSGPGGFFTPGTFNGTPCSTLGSLPLPATTANVRSLFTDCAVKLVPGGGNNGLPLYDNDFNNFAPVVGVAWDPFGDGKTSVRAGYRLSYMQDVFSIIDSNVDDNEGLVVDQDCEPVANANCQNNISFLRNLVDGNGNIVLTGGPTVAAAPAFMLPAQRTILDGTAQDFRTYEKNLGTAYYQEWTLGIQRELFKNWAVDLRYVGTRGSRLRRVADFNEYNILARDSVTGQTFLNAFILAQQNLACNEANGVFDDFRTMSFGCSMPNLLMDALIAGDASRLGGTTDMIDALRENQTGDFLDELLIDRTSRPASGQSRIRGGSFFGQVLAGRFPLNFFSANPFVASSRRMVGDGFSTYHALEVEVRRRPVGGFAFQANYTFQRAISDFDGDQNTLVNDSRPSSVRNPRYTSQEFMPRHLFKANWLYELPFGPGKRWNPQGFWAKLVSNWQMGGIINWRSGRPLSFLSGIGTFHRQAISGENSVNLSQPLSIGRLRGLIGERTISTSAGPGIFWFDPCLSSQQVGALTGGSCSDPNAIRGLFQLPRPGELGELPQTVIFGPRRFLFDFNLVKRTNLTESVDLEFRWEVFNAFNNTNFQPPITNIFNDDFGRIFRTISNPRLMQFAFKINF